MSSTPYHAEQGDIEFEPIPTASNATIRMRQMVHLGNVINSTRIRELINIAKYPDDRRVAAQLGFEFRLF